MSGKNIAGPPCLGCGNALRPKRVAHDGLTEEAARHMKRTMDPGYRAALRKPRFSELTWTVTYQEGWGGIGPFCGDNCAAAWAESRAKAYKFDPTTNRP